MADFETQDTDQLLCLQCGGITLYKDGLEGCSHCGQSKSLPCNLTRDTVAVNITWHELRILVIWAERWASECKSDDERDQMQKTLYRIADRIHGQHLDKRALTFFGELSNLRGGLGVKVEHNVIHEPKDEA
jgi:hypothetical protein